jgi:hypothetical protein
MLTPSCYFKITDKPIFVPIYRRSSYENEIISEEINLMLPAIQPSCSLNSSSVVIVPKPDGSDRERIDYRKLNSVSIADNFPMQRIQETLVSHSGS